MLRLLAAAGVAGVVAACSERVPGSRTAGSGPVGSAAIGPVPAPLAEPLPPSGNYDPRQPYWMQANFAPVTEEVVVDDLEVRGTLPTSLSGVFVRNGSNPATGPSAHWFLGDGMVHGVRLENGRAAWYRNRYVRTPLLGGDGGFGGGPPGREANASNVSLIHHAGRLLSMGEVGWPFELSVDDLTTVGPYSFDGRLTTAMTAHPKIDPATGDLHFFGYGFVPPYLTYHVADAAGQLLYSAPIDLPGPTMIHDFAITATDVVFWDLPVVFDLQAAIRMVQGELGTMPFRWDPDHGARIGVLPLGGAGEAIRWVEIEPCYVFHGTNAFRDGDEVVLDVCRLPRAFAGERDLEPSHPHRWRIDTAGENLRFREESHDAPTMDLPSIDRRFTGRDYRFGWYATVETDTPFPFEFAGVRRLDHRSGQLDAWEPSAHRAGEVVFVPEGPAAGEGEGWLLSFAWNAGSGKSDLVVLDATDVAAGPVATVALPVRVPYGFHGTWVPDEG